MLLNYARRLTGRQRSAQSNRHLGLALTFVAGAINAGGFLAVQQYTSHMTGILSSVADHMALGTLELGMTGMAALLSFLTGAACSAILVNFSRHRNMHAEYALPLLLEASLLLGFGLLAARLESQEGVFVSLTVMLLSFIMGLQNAVITKLSNAEIRTTHVTGIITDIGIELGKVLYRYAEPETSPVRVTPDMPRLRLLSLMALLFLAGGISGAFGFRYLGYLATVPLALVLIVLASVPVMDDLLLYWRRR